MVVGDVRCGININGGERIYATSYDYHQEQEYNKEIVKRLLNYLDTRAKTIVKSFYGIDTTEKTLVSIAEKEKITRERARQILQNSIHYLQENIDLIKNDSHSKYIRISSNTGMEKVIKNKNEDNHTSIALKTKDKHIDKKPVYSPLHNIINKRNYKSHNSREHKTVKISQINNIILQNIELKEINGLKIGEHVYYNNMPCIINRITKNKKFIKLYIEYDNGIKDVVSYNDTSIVKKKMNSILT